MASLQIVIDAINNASTEIGNLKSDIEEVGTAGETAGEGVGGFDVSLESLIGVASAVAEVIGAVIGAMEEVYEVASRGASVNTAAAQFEHLASSMGIVSGTAMADMQAASEGMITDMDLMAAGTKALSLGVADSSDDLARLAQVSADLGMPMEKVVDMVNNVSPAGFERVGVSMDGFKEQVAGIQAANEGWTKSQAETEAGLQRLEAQVAKVGSATDTQTAAFVKNEVALQNIDDIAAQNTALQAGPMVTAYQNMTQATLDNQRATLDATQAQKELKAAEEAGIITRDQYKEATKELGIHSGNLKGNIEGLESATELLDSAYAATGTTFDAVTGKVVTATDAVQTLNDTPLEDKEGTATYTLEDDEVKNYDPPTKYATVVYSAGGGGENVDEFRDVGGAVYGGNPYTWQEYGYKGELFVPSSDGFVMSRADAERALSKALTGGGAAMDPDAIGKAVAKALSGVTKGNQSGNVYNLTMPTSSNPADVRTAFELMEAWA